MSTAATAPRCVPTDGPVARGGSAPGAQASARVPAAAHRVSIAGPLATGVLLPLLVFALLASAVRAGPLAFDLALLGVAQRGGGGRADQAWALVTHFGYEWGVVPFDVMLVLVLSALRRWRRALFAAVALAGSGLLNVGAKLVFARARPDLWVSIAPEHNFSFPSGHAMGSMTLACVLVALAPPGRGRQLAVVGLGIFVATIGWSRVHLGVHFPSDILAGWALAMAWTMACRLAFLRGAAAA